MKTKYALSYNNLRMTNTLLQSISFKDEEQSNKFVRWFNKMINTRGRVSIFAICDKVKITLPEEKRELFADIGFTKQMEENDLLYSTYRSSFLVNFPMYIEDFTQAGLNKESKNGE